MAQITYREALNQALREELDRDERVFIMGEEVGYFGGAFKVTDGLLAVYGEKRVRDTPISELTIVGAGIGAAMGGLKPVVELMTINFALLAMDQIVNSAAKIHFMFGGKANVPIVIRAPQGGGHQLGAQHSQSLEAYFLHCPGLRVVIPATPADAKGLLKTAIRQIDPVMFLEHESLYGVKGEVPEDPEFMVPFGKANVIREGKDVTIVTYSKCVYDAIAAAEALENSGIDAEVVDLRTLNPLDMETVDRVGEKDRHARSSPTKDGAPAAPAPRSPRRFTRPPSTRSTRPSPASPRSTLRCRTTSISSMRRCRAPAISSRRRSS